MLGDETESVSGPVLRGEDGRFAADDVVGERYRVVGVLGRGGMGEVYEVHDQELGVRLALKTVRPEIAARPGAFERFKREVQLARRITHRSVCRVFDIGRHGDTIFLTMELLAGESLAERLARVTRLSAPAAIGIARQLADALDAAAAAGVVHRDLKSANVQLVPTERGERVVVTDFGLAEDPGEGGATPVPGALIGTPAYMAPEQVEGGAITAATDVYAFGIVLYEMSTGARPFSGATSEEVARRRLREAPVSPRTHLPSLPRRWERLILDCLARRPADRPSWTAIRARLAPRGWRVPAFFAVAAAAVATALTFGLAVRPTAPLEPAGGRRELAVVGFRNLSDPSVGWMGTALVELVASHLAGDPSIRVVSSDNVAAALRDLGAPGAKLDDAALAKLRGLLGADLVLVGDYGVDGAMVRVAARLVETRSGAVVTTLAAVGSEDDVAAVAGLVANGLRAKLSPAAAPPREGVPSYSRVPAALKSYAEGVEAIRRLDAPAARVALESAVAADPRFALAHSALAEVWSQLGYDARALAAAEKAYRLADELPREDRLLVEGAYREMNGALAQAIEIYASLWHFYPDNLEYGLLLARAQASASKAQAAFVTLSVLRGLPPPRGDDPRIDLVEALAAKVVGDMGHRLRAAEAAVRKGRARGARGAVAAARGEEGWALLFTPDHEAVSKAFDDARALAEAVGDRGMVSSNLFGQGIMRFWEGRTTEAYALYDEALRIRRETGDRSGEAEMLAERSYVNFYTGRLKAAIRDGKDAIVIANEIGNDVREAFARAYMSFADVAAGDLGTALANADRAMQIFVERKNQLFTIWPAFTRLLVASRRGDLVTADEGFGALAAALLDRARPYATFALTEQARLALDRGDLARATRLNALGLAIRVESRQLNGIALSLAIEGRLAAAAGRFEKARSILDASTALWLAQDGAPWATMTLAATSRLIAPHDPDGARARLARAQALGAAEPVESRQALATATAHVALVGSAAERVVAEGVVKTALAEAEEKGLAEWTLEGRLALGLLEKARGGGKARLVAVARDAAARGYAQISAEATAAIR